MLIASFALPADSAAPPASPAQVNLLAVGDVGYNPDPKVSPNTRTVAKALAEYVRSSPARFDAVVIPGDSFKVKLTGVSDKAFIKGFEQMYDPSILTMPFYVLLGNHDHDPAGVAAELAYSAANPQSRWKMPAQWYRVDFPGQSPASPLVTLLMLNSNKEKISSNDWKKQLKWLSDQLAKPRGTWTIVCAHKPAFSDGQHGDSKTVQTEFGPLLKKYNVEFYLSGHDHVLEHLQPDGWETTFLISGGGGENTNRPVNGHQAVYSKATPGFAHLQFTPTTATVTFLDAQCTALYSFQRNRNGTTPGNTPAQ